MPNKQNDRYCDCPECIESAGQPRGKLVPRTTYRSHQERKPFMKSLKKLPRIRLIVQQPKIQRATTFTLTPEQQLYAGSAGAGQSQKVDEYEAHHIDEADPYDFANDGSDYGDLYFDEMDIDSPPRTLHQDEPPASDDSIGAQEPQESFFSADNALDCSACSDSDSDRDEPFRFDVPEPPPPASEIFPYLPAKPFWKPFLLGVAYINLRFHSTHRACNLFLNIARIVLTHLGHFDKSDKPIVTLRASFHAIGLKEPFLVLPICLHCHRIYPADSPVELKCYKCLVPLFQSRTTLTTDFDGSTEKNKDRLPIPRLKCPFFPLSSQLPAFVCRFEDELEKSLLVEPEDGVLRDIRDGNVWKEARSKDGTFFFSPSNSDELRLGIILHFDGFGGERSRNGLTYSSGVLSYSVVNLPVNLRYKPSNLLIVALSPGPRESSCDELQHLLEAVVDDKVRLYEEGIDVKTPRYPNGRKIYVYCIADGCDHPALCRVFGFADHSHQKFFCTRCKIARDELNSLQGMTGAFPSRTGDEHRRLARKYRDAEPGNEPGQREELFKKNGMRYYAMSRLKYFDAVRMSAIDPMHNILLGICKSQWLDSWVRRNVLRERTRLKDRELDQIHAYLSTFEMPSWVGRLPSQVGYPAGGSLSADEYKALVLVYCPIIPLAQADFDKAIDKWEANERDPTKKSYEQPRLRMHPDDAENFLKLAASLKILLGRTVRVPDLERAEKLFKEYLEGYLTLHPLDVKPNHHWALHIFEQIRDFGPVYGFWTFTSERLNKVLKSFRTNNHNGGEIEVSFLRAFCRDLTLADTLRSLASTSSEDEQDEGGDAGLAEVARFLSTEDDDTRGTVASMSLVNREVEERTRETILGFKRPCLGASVVGFLEKELQDTLLEFYNDNYPEADVCNPTSRSRTQNHLICKAKFFAYLIKDGRRITACKSAEKAQNSIIQMEFNGRVFVGQVVSIFQHLQMKIGHLIVFVHVRWFRHSQDVDTNIWDQYPELEVFFWDYNDFLHDGELGPPSVITADRIKSQAARATVTTRPPRYSDDEEEPESKLLWVTIGLSRENIVI